MAVAKNDSTDRGLERIDPTPFEAWTSIKSLIFENVTSYVGGEKPVRIEGRELHKSTR